MNWRLFISLRYFISKRRERFISIISLISILGVALGVAALIIVIAVMSGFDNDLQEKIVGMNSHIIIESTYGVKADNDLLSKADKIAHVVRAAFFLNGQALVRREDEVHAVIIRGIEPKREVCVTKIAEYLKEGNLDLKGNGIIIGSELAKRLFLKIGDPITLFTSSYVEGKRFLVRGIFTSGMYEYDISLIYMGLGDAQELLSRYDSATGISVRVDDLFNAASVKKELQEDFRPPLIVRTWMDANRNLLAALKLEKTVMFIILTLIVLVACFNIASALIMTVLEKTKDIGILKAIGASNLDVMLIFAAEGGLIGFLGTALGTLVGIGLSWCLKTYKFISLPNDIYYIDKLPVKLELQDIALIVMASLFISFVSTLYPSYQASRLDPVEALRYE